MLEPRCLLIGKAFDVFTPRGHNDYEFTLLIMPIILTALGMMFYRQGVRIDLKYKKMKSYQCVFGVEWGSWRDLSAYNHLALHKDSILLQNEKGKEIQLAEFVDGNRARKEMYLLAKLLDKQMKIVTNDSK